MLGHGPIGGPVQHEIDVTARTQLIARQRPDQRDMRDACGPEVVGMGQQKFDRFRPAHGDRIARKPMPRHARSLGAAGRLEHHHF